MAVSMPNEGDGDYAARGTEPSGEAARRSRKPRASALEATAHRRTVGIMRDRLAGLADGRERWRGKIPSDAGDGRYDRGEQLPKCRFGSVMNGQRAAY